MEKGFKYRKAVQALNFFALKENGIINKMKAIKLIWLADRLHLRQYGRTIFSDNYWALKKGPIPSATTDLSEERTEFSDDTEFNYRDEFIEVVDKHHIKSKDLVYEKVFSKSDIEILTIIYSEFGQYNEFELSDISHKYPEWKQFEKKFSDEFGPKRFMIETSDFFIDSDSEDQIFKNSREISEISKKYFQENSQLESILR